MILQFPRAFPADAVEVRVPDSAAASALLGDREAPLQALFARWRTAYAPLLVEAGDADLLARTEAAVRIAYTRLALRHGHLGEDLHAYHNEGHILEICAGRLERLHATPGADVLSLRDWCALALFGAGHDLRQREAPQLCAGLGANERASTEETHRLLDDCGFSRERDADLYVATELMIAGSTFDARPLPGDLRFNAADLAQSGGALAATLDQTLDARRPQWRADADLAHAQQLALIAADLDTANVAEPFATFAHSGERLCREREMLSGRSLAAGASALPVLGFLGDGQERFFFELHRFHSALGRAAFAAAKQANAPQLKALATGLGTRIARRGAPTSGDQVITAYRTTVASLLEAGAQSPACDAASL